MSRYRFWQDSIEGLKPKMFVDDPQLGFFRKGIYQRDSNGNNKRIGWMPVAIFMVDEEMYGRVGPEDTGRDVTGTELNELWSYCAGNAVTEGAYRQVARHGKTWPDDMFSKNEIVERLVPAANREVTKADNTPEIEPVVANDYATGIDNAIAAALTKVTNETEAAQALGSKNRIAELRLAADKAGKVIYQPIFTKYKQIYALWSPMIARAETAEKKLNTLVLTFRETERRRIAAEEAKAEAAQRRIDEENERAAQRAIARGESEMAPVVAEAPAVFTPPAPLAPTYGTRKLKEEVKTFLESVDDFDAVYAYFKDAPETKAFLTTLATAAVKAGRAVPGTKTRTGLI